MLEVRGMLISSPFDVSVRISILRNVGEVEDAEGAGEDAGDGILVFWGVCAFEEGSCNGGCP